MAVQDIIQNLIFRHGQSQDMRMPEELGVHFADIDERSDEELLLFAKKFAEFVKFYPKDPSDPIGNWTSFFPVDLKGIRMLLQNKNGDVPPHLALFVSFLKLYQAGPQENINKFTGSHLDFFFAEILRLTQKPAVPDKSHVVLELKKNASQISIGPKDLFSAGKDNTKVELVYTPTGETVVNNAKIEQLSSFFYDKSGHGTIRYAPIANSSDGMGGKLLGGEPKWQAFGNEKNPPVEIGFAIASPVLRMQEGVRKVNLTLTLSNVDVSLINDTTLKGAFDLYLTGEKSWIGPFAVVPTITNGNTLLFSFTVPATEKAVVDYDVAIHGYRYTTKSPVIQVLLKTGQSSSALGYNVFAGVKIKKAKVTVDVSGVTSLSLEGDQGILNAKKPFTPFGPVPTKGSTFLVGYEEALSKKITELSVSVAWKNPPTSFGSYYSAYGETVNNDSFTADVVFSYKGNPNFSQSNVHLFDTSNAAAQNNMIFTPGFIPLSVFYPIGLQVYSLQQTGTVWANSYLQQMFYYNPVLINKPAIPEPAKGFIRFTLNKSFYHAEYPKKTVENILRFSKQIGTTPAFVALNEPYTPVIQNISLSYKASSDDVSINTLSLDDFTNDEIQFFQIAWFGQIQEHSYQRNLFNFLVDKSVSLFPEYKNEGELVIGFSNLKAGDSVSVLFQVAEGSEDPELDQVNLDWAVLSDNYWKPMAKSEVVLDTTNKLLRSGIIKFVLPHDATTSNSLMPPDWIWIKASIKKNVKAVCQLVSVVANALEVQFTEMQNDPDHLVHPLEKNKITKLKDGNASVKSVTQPFASFGGMQKETHNALYTRGAERLRHKNRAITSWDYERLVLEAFPEVHKVKCIPHAKFMPSSNKYCWLAPGNVVLVVVPDLTNKNAVDPLSPKVNGNTISNITQMVNTHSGIQVNVKVKNPAYQKLRLAFKVKFHEGYEFNFYAEKLKDQIKEYLSPWAYASSKEISFGGKIYKSVLLDFVEEIEYVDYLEDFYLYSISELTGQSGDLNEVQPETPDTILVSDQTHIINEIY
ncbi:MAG: baseplate J/gp47 family protein [Prolixibacteraceae bacterium]